MDTQAALQPGELCIFLLFILFCKGILIVMINVCRAVHNTAMD